MGYIRYANEMNTIYHSLAQAPLNEKGIELEARFGEFHGKRFVNGITSTQFFSVLQKFQQNALFQEIYDDIINKTKNPTDTHTIYEKLYDIHSSTSNYVLRVSYNNPNEVFMMIKKRIQNSDIINYYTRWSISKEAFITPTETYGINISEVVQPSNLSIERTKTKWSFMLKPNVSCNNKSYTLSKFRVDFTIIQDVSVRHPVYQIEIEVLSKYIKTINANEIWDAIYFMLLEIHNTNFVINRYERSQLFKEFNSFFSSDIQKYNEKRKKAFQEHISIINILNKPINMKKKLLDDPSQYAITDKADGIRRLIYINKNGVYFMYPDKIVEHMYVFKNNSNDSQHQLSQKKYEPFMNSIFDCEIVIDNTGTQRILIFDCLVMNNTDIRHLPFRTRYEKIQSLINISDLIFELKYFSMPTQDNFYDRARDLWKNIKTLPYGNDGLILNNIEDGYDNLYNPIYKWKPPNMLTIDFYLQKTDTSNVYQLLVKEHNTLVSFQGNTRYPFNGTYIMNKKGSLLNLSHGQIVEFAWNYETDTFEPLRIRLDKLFPNYITVALSVWKDIHDPITIDTITGKDLIPMRRYHNTIKRQMISTLEPHSILLDIGAGRGGDVLKWIDSKLNVFVVEPDIDHIQELIKRLEQNKYHKIKDNVYHYNLVNNDTLKVIILNTIGEDTTTIVNTFQQHFGARKADAISMFNSLTFMFKDKSTFNSLLSTINKLLRENGIFMGIVMDGYAVKQLMVPYYDFRNILRHLKEYEYFNLDDKSIVSKKFISDDSFYINKKWKLVSTSKQVVKEMVANLNHYKQHDIQELNWHIKPKTIITDNPFGNTIFIHLDDTIVSTQTEYLVDFKHLEQALGYKKIEDCYLRNNYLSVSQQKLNSLYRLFKFKRTSKNILTDDITLPLSTTDIQEHYINILLPEQKAIHKIKDFNMIRIGNINDRHCLLHALARAVVNNYIDIYNTTPDSMLTDIILKKRIRFGNRIENLLHTKYKLSIIHHCPDWITYFDTYKETLQQLYKVNIILLDPENDRIINTDSMYSATVFLLLHDDVIDTLARQKKDGSLQTIFHNQFNIQFI